MRILAIATFFLLSIASQGQITMNGQEVFGHEWIDQTLPHIKIKVIEEGMYKVTYDDLVANGFPAAQINGNDLQLFSMGRQVTLHNTTEGDWNSGDYLVFHGDKQRGELDAHLFEEPETQQLNPQYSMFADEKTYFLRLKPNANFSSRYRMVENNLGPDTPLRERYYMEKEMQIFNQFSISPGTPSSDFVHFSHFITMEGFSSIQQKETNIDFPVVDYYNGADAQLPSISLRTGSNNVNHIVQLSFNNSLYHSDSYTGAVIKQYEHEMDRNNIRNNRDNRLKLKAFGTADNLSVAYAELCYPREFDAKGESHHGFYSGSTNFEQYIEYPNLNATRAFVFDVENEVFLEAEMDGTTAKFILPPGAVKQARCHIIDAEVMSPPLSLEPVEFIDIKNLNPSYLILTSKVLNKDDNGVNPIEAYANFRESALGGSYEVEVINVEQIYDQFGFGVDEHSLAIRNFAQHVKTQWPNFELAFIIGKALTFANKTKNLQVKNIVPTFGRPGSDNLLFAENEKTFPFVGVGRLAAQSTEDIMNYLDKARINAMLGDVANLTIEDRLWLKNVIHLSGGSADIQEDIYNKLNFMANIIENNEYGAKVTTFQKNSTDPVTTALTEEILKNINNGVSMLTFFGHSSAGTFDFSVEDVTTYENEGKHPVVFSMGCHSGDIHENLFSLSEEFILTKDLGGIAFIAASGNAFIDPLATVGIGFYDDIGTEFYGKPIGLAMQKVLEEGYNKIKGDYDAASPNILSFFNTYVDIVTLHEQNTIHGDPAVSFFSATAADYIVDFSSVKTMDVVGTTDEYADLEFDILNLGANRTALTEMNNYIIHRYGNDNVDTIFFTSPVPANRITVQVQLPNAGREALGKNSINIVLDYDNQIPEAPMPIAEDNNDLLQAWNTPEGFCFYVFDNNAQPIFPTEFGIVGEQGFDLVASSSNALAAPAIYLLELDTTETFDSPFLQKTEVNSSPAAIRWNPGITYENNVVYYWRVKPRDLQQAIWSNSSFIYLEDSEPGWNQSHYYQWTKDRFDNSSMDSTSRDFVFTENISEIRIKNGTAAKDIYIPEIIYQNNPTQYLRFGGEITSGVYLSTFDGLTGAASNNVGGAGEYGSLVASEWVENFICYPYWTNTKEQRELPINFIENVVPSGDYIALFTIQRSDVGAPDYKPELWAADGDNGDPDLMSVLEKYGATRVRDLAANPVPYIFIFKKDDPSFTPIEVVATDAGTRIETAFKIVGRWHEGEIGSTTIGPAQSWDKLLWNIDEIDLAEDGYRLDISGCDEDGNESVLFEDVDEFQFDLSSVDADQYPYLKLNLFSTDSTSRTAPQMEYWRVLYAGLPEAVLDINQKFVYDADTMSQGDVFKFQTIATNVTDVDMDSLLVEYTITDSQNNTEVYRDVLAPLKAKQSLDLDFELETSENLGVNQFKVEINPREDQKEQHYYNNVGLRNFQVGGDNVNPLLDVTFDGVRIMNGDMVSPSPVIVAVLKDENSNLPVTDVNNFEFTLQSLPDGQAMQIDLNGENVMFFPADSTNGYCARVEFTPEPALESGEYLLSVQAWDASGNLSGDSGISVEFEVERDSKISNVLTYPNPFSTQTQFVFTLTGMQVPDVFTIQIYTMSGKVVKEITKEELGPLRIGVNRTDYKWNGTDDFGNRLANGVYLYRVITSQVEGEDVKHYDNADVDGFFHKGFGKLVIMR